MRLAIALALLYPSALLSQVVEMEVEKDLRLKVADIAALSVRNTDDLAALRDRVAGIETKIPSILSRLDQLEAKAFEVIPTLAPAPVVVTETITSTPQYLYSSPIVPTVKTVQAPTIQRREYRTPIRRVFRFLFSRRVTGSTVSRSGSHWTFPGDLSAHLIGPPHYLDPSYVYSLSQTQRLDLHDSLHGEM